MGRSMGLSMPMGVTCVAIAAGCSGAGIGRPSAGIGRAISGEMDVGSQIDCAHSLFPIAWAGGCPRWQEAVYLGEFLFGELNIQRAHIFLQVTAALGSGYRDDVIPLRQNPS